MPSVQQRLRVAVIGAGPAGLGALLALEKVEGVDVQVYEQARELREVGAGISLHYNTWTVLEKLGVPYIPSESFFRNSDLLRNGLWNGRTGAVLKTSYDSPSIPEHKRHVRTQRARLQQALLNVARKERLHLQKRLAQVDFLPSGEVRLEFEDGYSTFVDLVVGADGIRSVVRRAAFPSHTIAYSGRVGYRSIFPISLVEGIPDIPLKTLFWLGPDTSLYTTPIGDGLFEVSGRGPEPKEVGEAVSWGQPADKETMKRHFTEYHPVARAIVDAIPPETIKQFAFFGGPQLETVIKHGSVALLGDASHPLSGAFGSGAAFALEDAWTLGQAISHALSHKLPLSEALRLFDETRSPYYSKLYTELRRMGAAAEKGKNLPWDERVADRIDERWGSHDWIYLHDVRSTAHGRLRCRAKQIRQH
ncbi:salicylate hydroxylase [Polyporus arcularius HHB13444]|uniref:Salicylate hydroxylase n=1 Tax=Polyporus arcularius HHB13444 TaxID=1314778 RepID=A0A5C3PDQ8_9APHY|nr:salicylate hydroxylase [Polyporus arcularius HHB13444]